jgi:glycosyltransferase 2 family protein
VKRYWRLLAIVPVIALVVGLLWWHGPDWHAVHDAFTVVRWDWVVIAIGLNLLSVFARSLAWDTTIRQSVAPPRPGYPLVFSAFCVGLFGNAVLPGRVGELARVAVLRRRMPGRKGTTATLIGSVVAHRMFDLFPVIVLVVWVLFAATLPATEYFLVAAVVGVGVILFAVAWIVARFEHRASGDGMGRLRRLLVRLREGLAVMRTPAAAAQAASFQFVGWFCQLLAVWATMHAFHIYLPFAAAGLVLVVMNIVTIVPFWPGNIGLLQVAIATALKPQPYHVAYAHGVAYGIGLQAIEASVGIGIGLIFLAREGLSYAMLKQFESPVEEIANETTQEPEPERARAGVSG